MTMNSSDVTSGNNARASEYVNLRKDVRNAIKDEQVGADGATITFNLTNGAIHSVTLGGNRTLAVSNPTAGQSFMVILKQDGTGSRTVTWWSGIKWIEATVPTLTTTLSRADIFAFFYDGTSYYGTVVGQNFG